MMSWIHKVCYSKFFDSKFYGLLLLVQPLVYYHLYPLNNSCGLFFFLEILFQIISSDLPPIFQLITSSFLLKGVPFRTPLCHKFSINANTQIWLKCQCIMNNSPQQKEVRRSPRKAMVRDSIDNSESCCGKIRNRETLHSCCKVMLLRHMESAMIYHHITPSIIHNLPTENLLVSSGDAYRIERIPINTHSIHRDKELPKTAVQSSTFITVSAYGQHLNI